MKPSRFIINSDYATLKNDDEGTLSLTIPDSFVVPNTGITFAATANIGSKSAGMRWLVASDKYPDINLLSPVFTIPCKYTLVMGEETISYSRVLTGCIFRSAPGTVKMTVIPNYAAGVDSTSISECGQTITARVQTFVSPFES